MKRKRKESESAENFLEINVTPLADVALVLVIILMLLMPTAIQSMIRVQSEKAGSGAEGKFEKPIMVEITTQGLLVGDKKAATVGELSQMVADRLRSSRSKQVVVIPHRNVRHGDVVNILDVIKQDGAQKISVVRQ